MGKKLEWGCKVRATQKAVMGSVLINGDTGIFLGYGKNCHTVILVVKAKQRTPNYYHSDFWEVV